MFARLLDDIYGFLADYANFVLDLVASVGSDYAPTDPELRSEVSSTGANGNPPVGADGDDFLINLYESTGVIFGYGGDDTITGGNGVDRIFAGADNDEVRANAGADRVFGQSGDDTLSGDDGDDYLDGGSGNDTLYGGHGDDTLTGGSGEDTLVSGSGSDVLIGGSDADTFRIHFHESEEKQTITIRDFDPYEGDIVNFHDLKVEEVAKLIADAEDAQGDSEHLTIDLSQWVNTEIIIENYDYDIVEYNSPTDFTFFDPLDGM